ncbi:MAG: hypothetical protein PHY83_05750 [Bacilli bacterium]|nr:hypothetical protein [Bacilli bacterium]
MKEITARKNVKDGFTFLFFALLAFSGLGLEMLLAFLIEPFIYGIGLEDFSTTQYIIHWIVTCILWGISAFLLLFFAKRKFGLDIFANKKNIQILNWILCFVCFAIAITISVIDWNGFKPVKEFAYNGWLKFVFQYIYYIFEIVLVFQIVIFGQEAGEKWFKQDKIPYGGILTALTWGLIHCLTKGDIIIGLLSFVVALLFGVVYVLTKKNVYIAFPFILIMFIF